MNKLMKKIEKKRFRRERKKLIRKYYADDGETKLRYAYDLNPDSTVLDLGGYEGQWASNLFSRYLCNIYVFEPVTTFAKAIEERFIHNDKITVYPFGLGGATRTELIHVDADGSSTMGSSTDVEKIRIVDIHEWLVENSIEEIALIKINIEGGEYELLDRMIETGTLPRIANLQIQFHNFTEDARSRMENIQRELGKTHHPTYQYEFVWENWSRKT